MDYEREYKELKRKVDQVYIPLINKAMHLLEDEPGEFCENYKNSIAPIEANLPTIMTMATPTERKELIAEARRKFISHDEWTGPITAQGRPIFSRPTQRALEQQLEGKRSAKKVLNKKFNIEYSHKARVGFLAYHLVLIEDNRYPTETKNCASHLCHTPTCVKADHLEWSSADDNNRRRKCAEAGRCVCRLDQPCIFGVH